MKLCLFVLLVVLSCCFSGCRTEIFDYKIQPYSNAVNIVLEELKRTHSNETLSYIFLKREGSVNKILFDVCFENKNKEISIISYVYNLKTKKIYKHNPFSANILSFHGTGKPRDIKIHKMFSIESDGDYKILDSISAYENYPDIPIDKKIMEKEIIKKNNSFYKIKGCSVENIFSKFKKELKQQYNHIPEYYSVILIEFNYELDMACVYFYY